MKLWVKFEGASDNTALKVALSDEGVNSGDIDVADLLKDYIPGVLDVGGRQPSSLRLIKYAPPSSADVVGSGEENAHSNFTTIKEVLEAANKAVADAADVAAVVAEPVEGGDAAADEDGDEGVSSTPPPPTPPPTTTPSAPPQIIVLSVRLLEHTPEVVSTPSASPTPPTRTSRVSGVAPRTTTSRLAATTTTSASSRGSGGWNGSSRAVSTASSTAAAPAATTTKSYVRQPSAAAAASSSSGRVSLMDRSKQYAKTAAETKAAAAATPGSAATTTGARSGSAIRGGRISTIPTSRGASPVVKAPVARTAAPAPKPKTDAPASRVATPTRRLSEARPGEVPPLSAPSPRRNSGAVDPDDLPPPSHDPSDNDVPEKQEEEVTESTTTSTTVVVPTSAKRVEHPSPTPDRPGRPTVPRTSTSPSRRGPHAAKSPQPFDRQLSRSALAATPRSRSNQTPDPFRHSASMNSSHATTTTSDAGPAPEYVSRLYPDPEDTKKREKEAQRRAAMSKPQVSPAEKKQRAVHQREYTNRMYSAAASKGAPTSEVCSDFKPLWGQSTCAKCQHGKTAHILKKREMDREAKARIPSLPVPSDDGTTPIKPATSSASSSTRTAPRAAVAKTSTPLRRPLSTARAPSATTNTTAASARSPTTRSTPTRQAATRDSPKPVRVASGARTPLARQPTPTGRTTPAAGTAVKTAAGRGTPTRPPMSPMRRLGSTAGTPASAAKKAPGTTTSKKAPSPSSAKKQQPQSPLKKSDVSSSNPIVADDDTTPARPSTLEDPEATNESFFLSKQGSPVNIVSSPITPGATAPVGGEGESEEDAAAIKEERERKQMEANEMEILRRAEESEQRDCTPENTSTTAGRPELEMTPGTAMMMMCSDSSPDRSAIATTQDDQNTPIALIDDEKERVDEKKIEDGDEMVFGDEAAASSPDFRKPTPPGATADDAPHENENDGVSAATPITTSEEPPVRTTAPPSASPPFDPFGDIDEDIHQQEELAAAASRDVSVNNNNNIITVEEENERSEGVIVADDSKKEEDNNDAAVATTTSIEEEKETATTTTPEVIPQEEETTTAADEPVVVVADTTSTTTAADEKEVRRQDEEEVRRPTSTSVDPNAATVSMSEDHDEFAFLNDVPESIEPSPQPSRVEEELQPQPDQAVAPATPTTTSNTEGTKTQRPPSRTRGPRSGSTPRCSSASGRASGRSSVNNSPSRSGAGGSFKRQNSWRQASCHHQQLEEAGLSNGSGRSPQTAGAATTEGTGVPPLSPSLTPRDPSTSHFDPEAAPPADNDEPDEVNGRPTLPPPSDNEEEDVKKEELGGVPEESNNDTPLETPASPPTSPQFGLLSGVAAFLAETEAEGVEHVDMSALPPRSPARTTPATSGPPSQEVSRTSSMNKISRTVFEEY